MIQLKKGYGDNMYKYVCTKVIDNSTVCTTVINDMHNMNKNKQKKIYAYMVKVTIHFNFNTSIFIIPAGSNSLFL